jgi:hypothetical protein
MEIKLTIDGLEKRLDRIDSWLAHIDHKIDLLGESADPAIVAKFVEANAKHKALIETLKTAVDTAQTPPAATQLS